VMYAPYQPHIQEYTNPQGYASSDGALLCQ